MNLVLISCQTSLFYFTITYLHVPSINLLFSFLSLVTEILLHIYRKTSDSHTANSDAYFLPLTGGHDGALPERFCCPPFAQHSVQHWRQQHQQAEKGQRHSVHHERPEGENVLVQVSYLIYPENASINTAPDIL